MTQLPMRPACLDPALSLAGTLHIIVVFDWGDEILLDVASKLVFAEATPLARRPRTPSSIAYRPAPLRMPLEPITLKLAELGDVSATAAATLFDIGSVSVTLAVPFSLSPIELSRLAGGLAVAAPIVDAVRAALTPWFARLAPAIRQPIWSELSEEYFIFQAPPTPAMPTAQSLVDNEAGWLAGLLRLESQPLSAQEIAESLRLRLMYTPDDLLLVEWSACVLVDHDCGETLQMIEFANVQLLEFRHIANRLDDRLDAAYALIHPLASSRLPFWRNHHRPLRALGELKVEANGLFERTGNVLKLVGDQYLVRAYRQLVSRFHLDAWEHDIERSLNVVQEVYQVISDQAAAFRIEVLEIIVVVLIMIEVGLSLARH